MKQVTPGIVNKGWWAGKEAICEKCHAVYTLEQDDNPHVVTVAWPRGSGWLGFKVNGVAMDCPECGTRSGLVCIKMHGDD